MITIETWRDIQMKSYHAIIKGFHIGLFMFVKHDRIRFEVKLTRNYLYLRALKSSFIWGLRKKNVRTLVRREFNWSK